MDLQNIGELQGISRELAASELGIPDIELVYCAWPETFGGTAGPSPGIGGQAISTFTLEAWYCGRHALIFCNGKIVKTTDKFQPPSPIRI